jgi:hypothetical protein
MRVSTPRHWIRKLRRYFRPRLDNIEHDNDHIQNDNSVGSGADLCQSRMLDSSSADGDAGHDLALDVKGAVACGVPSEFLNPALDVELSPSDPVLVHHADDHDDGMKDHNDAQDNSHMQDDNEMQYDHDWICNLPLPDSDDDVQDDDEEKQEVRNLMLHELQRTMDPLIAARLYNATHSLLARLPEELLLEILHCLGRSNEVVALYCLRRVSARLRRLINEPDILQYLGPKYTSSRFLSSRFCDGVWICSIGVRDQLREFLQRDNMCGKCILSIGRRGTCQFQGHGCRLWCSGCNCEQDRNEFSCAEVQKPDQDRQCLARQGAVALCEHVRISWADIEAHILEWEQKKEPGNGSWQACFDGFELVCRHASHDTRCTAEEDPTWPRATLRTAKHNMNHVFLELHWNPHSGPGVLRLTPGGRMVASELRELFAKQRQGPASVLWPYYSAKDPPEMLCFDDGKCRCLYYETGICEEKIKEEVKAREIPLNCPSRHTWRDGLGYWGHGLEVEVRSHWPWGPGKSVCLKTSYRRDVLVFVKNRGFWSRICAPHAWFHAMDPDTHEPPFPCVASSVCKDKRCWGYYRRSQPRIFCRFTLVRAHYQRHGPAAQIVSLLTVIGVPLIFFVTRAVLAVLHGSASRLVSAQSSSGG